MTTTLVFWGILYVRVRVTDINGWEDKAWETTVPLQHQGLMGLNPVQVLDRGRNHDQLRHRQDHRQQVDRKAMDGSDRVLERQENRRVLLNRSSQLLVQCQETVVDVKLLVVKQWGAERERDGV